MRRRKKEREEGEGRKIGQKREGGERGKFAGFSVPRSKKGGGTGDKEVGGGGKGAGGRRDLSCPSPSCQCS